ncbi:MAG TPA: hypothetical protein VF704_01335 [Allosphingosinicella sp.]
MNELAKAIRKDGRSLVELPEGMELEAGLLKVVRIGRTITLEPVDASPPVSPGFYTPETLPALSAGAKAIVAAIDAKAPFVDLPASIKSADGGGGMDLEDPGLEGIDVSDDGFPGLDPDR